MSGTSACAGSRPSPIAIIAGVGKEFVADDALDDSLDELVRELVAEADGEPEAAAP